jgi:hypothetical protein
MSLHNFFQSNFPTKRSMQRSARRVPRGPRRARLGLEALEDRVVLDAQLVLSGPQTLVHNTNFFVSQDSQGRLNTATSEDEMQIAVNPTNPLNVVGLTHNVKNTSEIQVFFSKDGGQSWSRRALTDHNGNNSDGSININDGQGFNSRSDPSVAFDTDGNLFVSYGIAAFGTDEQDAFARLIVGRSGDGGQTFNHFYTAAEEAEHGLDQARLSTGRDPFSGHQAVYITYSDDFSSNAHLTDISQIEISGFRFGVDTGFRAPVELAKESGLAAIGSLENSTSAVGPNGELYVAWHDRVQDPFGGRSRDDIFVTHNLKGLFDPRGVFALQTRVDSLIFPGVQDLLTPPAQPRRGFGGFPAIAVDRSGGPFNGRVYIAYTLHIAGDTTDILLSISTDQGNTWSSRDPGRGPPSSKARPRRPPASTPHPSSIRAPAPSAWPTGPPMARRTTPRSTCAWPLALTAGSRSPIPT